VTCLATDVTTTDHPRYQDALDYLYGRINYERMVDLGNRYRFRLERMAELLKRLGLAKYLYAPAGLPGQLPPVPLIHIAGTKGKGSTAAMVAAALTQSGLTTGLYTSPHLHRLEERFRVRGVPCSTRHLVEAVDRLRGVVGGLEPEFGPPSFFELTTALAILHFDTVGCNAIVLEVGLGGRLDSTNVCAPSVTAVTSIGLDHQHVLGDTLEKIAAEKAGIIKPRIPVVSGVSAPGAAAVVADRADFQDAELFQLGEDFHVSAKPADDWGIQMTYRGSSQPLGDRLELGLHMEGMHQSRNAAVAIAILRLLGQQGIVISDSTIATALGSLACEGRIERFDLPRNVLGIVDSAHNRDSIGALCRTLQRRCRDRPLTIVFGTSIDKDAGEMLRAIGRFAEHLVLTRFWGNPRYQQPAALIELVPETLRNRSEIIPDPIQACEHALPLVAPGGCLVVCGSFFLAAETRHWFQSQQR